MPKHLLFLAFSLLTCVTICASYTTDSATFFEFGDSSVTVTEGPYTGYSIKGTAVTINASGTYVFSGTCADGSIKVKKATSGTVRVVLAGLTLTTGGTESTDGDGLTVHTATAPLLINKENTVIVEAYEGTVNTLTDSPYNNDDMATSASTDTENAVLKIKAGSTATLCGSGTLKLISNGKNGIKAGSETDLTSLLKIKELTLDITANVNDGISVENKVKIYSGAVTVNAAGDGIQAEPDEGDESGAGDVVIYGGTFVLTCGGEGIQASNEVYVSGGSITATTGEDGIKGEKNVFIEGGTINVTSALDGIQSDEGGIYITNGTIAVKAGGGSSTKLTSSDDSCKGIKAETTMVISGGSITVNSADDCIHSDNAIAITGGTFTLATSTSGKNSTYSGGDAIHADYTLVVGNDGGGSTTPSITITSCYEGLEAATIYVRSGYIKVSASDDGFNAANKNIAEESTTDFTMNIYGGDIHITAAGDGLDSNGNMKIYGGTIEVNCTATGGNNALDTADRGYLSVSGNGSLVALGPSDMAVTPNANYSTVPYVTFGNASQGGGPGGGGPGGQSGGWGGSSSSSSLSIPSGTTWYISNSSGTTLATGTTASTVSYVVFSSSAVIANQTYYLKYGSTSKSATATASKASSVKKESIPSVTAATSDYAGTKNETFALTVNGTTTEKEYGKTVTVTAEAVEGSTFLSWTAVGIDLDDTTAQTLTFNMPANDVTLTAKYDETSSPVLKFSDSGIARLSGTSQGYAINGTTLTISAANTYTFSGNCANGNIVVAKGVTGVVLVLNGLDLTSTSTAPILLNKNAEAVILVAAGTENSLADAAANATNEKGVVKGKSGASLTIEGTGALTVTANGKNGVKGGADGSLTLREVTLTVTAVNDAISSDNTLVIENGSYNLSADGDGLVASPDVDDSTSVGAITISGGSLTIVANESAIEAKTLSISGGSITATGAFAGLDVGTGTISGGTLEIYATSETGSAISYTETLEMSGGCLIAGDSNTSSQSLTEGDGLYSALVACASITANESRTICLSTGGTMEITTAQDVTHLILANADIQGSTANQAFATTLEAGWNLVVLPPETDEDEISGLSAFAFDVASKCYVRVAKAGEAVWLFTMSSGDTLSGTSAANCWVLPRQSGWHLVGAPFDIPSAWLGDTTAWHYENGAFVQASDGLVCGKAYWVYVEK